MCISWASCASVMINMLWANLDLEFSGNLSFKYRWSIFKYFSCVFSMASKFDSWPTIRPSVQKAMAIVINISCVLSMVSISLLFNQELIFWKNYNYTGRIMCKWIGSESILQTESKLERFSTEIFWNSLYYTHYLL